VAPSLKSPLKLSSPATREFWEIPVIFEDEYLLALNKPSGLLLSPDRLDPARPSLLKLLHGAIAQGKPWTKERGLSYLMNAHRLDCDTSGVLLLAKSKPLLVALANLFGADQPVWTYLAFVQGTPTAARFEVDAPLAPHPARPGLMRVDRQHGKRAKTLFEEAERFAACTLLRGRTQTNRTHQIRVHLQFARLPIAGDTAYGGAPLLLSRLKQEYRLKPGRTERPLLSTTALHAETLELPHPVTGQPVVITADWPKDFAVALKYLRRYAGATADPAPGP
jgi:RluA family pseudouridine synthase